MTKEVIIPSSGNVFADLGFPPEEAALLSMRAQLMATLSRLLTPHTHIWCFSGEARL